MQGLSRVHPLVLTVFGRHKCTRCLFCNESLKADTMGFKVTILVPVIHREEVFLFTAYGHQKCSESFMDEMYPELSKYCRVTTDEITSNQVLRAKRLLSGLSCATCQRLEYRAKPHGKCGECQCIVYCSEECQVSDWPRHKKTCAALKGCETLVADKLCVSEKCKRKPFAHIYNTFIVAGQDVKVHACSLKCLRHAYYRMTTLCAADPLIQHDPKILP